MADISVTIKTDGTLDGTSLMVNGADVTKTQTVTRIYFSAYSPDPRDRFPSDEIYLSWDVVEEDDEGIKKTVGYRIDTDKNVVYRGIGRAIGDKAKAMFQNDSDEKAYSLTDNLKKLEDVVEVKDAGQELNDNE